MTTAEAAYRELAARLQTHAGVATSQKSGQPCLTVQGKPFLARHGDVIAFKLEAPQHAAALALPGAALWDPAGSGRPKKTWVALKTDHATHFDALADAALDYVRGVA